MSVEAIQGIIASMKGDYEIALTITSSKMPSSPKNAAIFQKAESYGRNEKRRSEVIPVYSMRVARQPSLLIDSYLCITSSFSSENQSKLTTAFFCMQQAKSSVTPLLLTALVTNTLCLQLPVTNFSPKIFVPCWLNLFGYYSNDRVIHGPVGRFYLYSCFSAEIPACCRKSRHLPSNGIDPEAYLRHILSILPEWPPTVLTNSCHGT